MKELSIEEKAKAYDEVIKKAESLYKAAEPMSGCNVIIETLFPKLKESEDERIRKSITEFFKNFSKNGTYKAIPDVTKWIAWLEKQGKNNIGISEATKKKLEDNLNKALEKETPESWNKFLDKQCEQKPAWREEDDAMFNFIALILRNHQSDEDFTTFETTFKDCIDWFKNLKDRVQPQPKQEWSEKDERMFKSTIALIETLEDYNKAPDGFGDVKFWLKFLKERYTWKPSDEQTEALSIAMCGVNDPLFSLYQDLKKLREK